MIDYKIFEKSRKTAIFDLIKKSSSIKIISPFFTGSIKDPLIQSLKSKQLQIITRLYLPDVLFGSLNINLIEFLNNFDNISIKTFDRSLHSKVFIFDNKRVLISSANFTNGGLVDNLEYGVETNDPKILNQSIDYFLDLWSNSNKISLELIEKVKKDKKDCDHIVKKIEKYKNINIDYSKLTIEKNNISDTSILAINKNLKTNDGDQSFIYVNFEENNHRTWEDAVRYGFVSAGHGPKYRDQLKKLVIGDKVVVYFVTDKQNRTAINKAKHGYIGYGIVIDEAKMLRDFLFSEGNYESITFQATNIQDDYEDEDYSEYLVKILWINTLSIDNTIKFKGRFYYRQIRCELSNLKTLNTLKEEKLITEHTI